MKITGLMIYYYNVCKRKLWLSFNEISLESENENVSVGKFIDDNSYANERKHILINNEINIDYVKKDGIIHEIKKSRKIEKASIWQSKYYIYYLEKLGVENIKAKIDYPLLKEVVQVELSASDRIEIENMISEIQIILKNKIPKFKLKKICEKCAFNDLCRI